MDHRITLRQDGASHGPSRPGDDGGVISDNAKFAAEGLDI